MSNQEAIQKLHQHISKKIIGQELLVNRLLIALLADGHLLVEGAPGLAKTRAIKVLGEGLEADFHRIQFTPDLLPADLTGTEIFRPQDGSFKFQKGPLFHNLVLADEINRAPAKVQSALLEAMAERQITVGSVTYKLSELFLVMATQNPIEQEGTYALPEAQLDRFLMHVRIDYPDAEAERDILHLVRKEAHRTTGEDRGKERGEEPQVENKTETPFLKCDQKTIFSAREEILGLYMAEPIERYLLEIVLATRNPASYDASLALWVQYGASPRASIALDRCARAHAWLAGRDYVAPEDIQSVAFEVLRHRVLLSYEAEADGITPDRFIEELISRIAVP